jgi:hypothetical protein
MPVRRLRMLRISFSIGWEETMSDILIGLLIYFLPVMIGMLRGHPDLFQIAFLNVFYGWTGIGWVGALVWAISGLEEFDAKE